MVNLIAGAIVDGEPIVTIDGVALDPARSLAVVNHSPDGFAWGYGGSGPAQLALAILLALVGPELAVLLYQPFKWQFIATADVSGDLFVQIDVGEWVREWSREEMR
jgi:hypothetical protein